MQFNIDKENFFPPRLAAGSSSIPSAHKGDGDPSSSVNHQTKKPSVLPTLFLSNFCEPLFLDFHNVEIGTSRAITFAMEVGNATKEATGRNKGRMTTKVVDVDRVPKNVKVTLSEKTGIVMWTPTTAGAMREVVLLSLNGRHRLQITIHGHAVLANKSQAQHHQKNPHSYSFSASCHVGYADDFGSTSKEHHRRPLMPSSTKNVDNGNGQQESPFSCQPRRLLLDKMTTADGKENDTAVSSSSFDPSNGIPPMKTLSSAFHDLEHRLEAVLKSRQHQTEEDEVRCALEFPEAVAAGECRKSLSAPSSPLRRGRTETRIAEDSREVRASSMGLVFERQGKNFRSRAQAKPIASFRQEKLLTEWLNFVLVPPNSYHNLAHPGEFLKWQTDQARAQVRNIFEANDIVQVRQAVTKEIARKRLQVRSDKDLYADLNLREEFIELLLSYQLPWLQVGLEVVLGVEITKSRLVKGKDGQLVRVPTVNVLRKLIVQHILSDPDVVKSYAGRPSHRVREAYQFDLRANTIQRFLDIVILLDRAKAMEILPRQRPLFKPSASVKSSAEVLLVFAKNYLAGEGNLLRHLAGLGYTVQHKQHYLDEFDFRISALCRDLRDGVRLARLVDLLEARQNEKGLVCDHLRVPPGSRLQKVHNVKIALEALTRRGLHGLKRCASGQAVGPEDIVDGHREKTVAMLWEVIRHYNLDYLVSSFTGITRFQGIVRGLITRRRFLRLKGLAINLQRLYRSRCLLFHCRAFSKPVVCVLQSHWRRQRATKLYKSIKQSVTVIQAHTRKMHARKQFVLLKTSVVRLQQLRRQAVAARNIRLLGAAITITKMLKGHMARRMVTERKNSIIKLQALWRMRQAKIFAYQRARAVQTIQAFVRGGQARTQLSRWKSAVIRLQAHHRARMAQSRYCSLRNHAIHVQSWWRSCIAAQHYASMKKAALRTQSWVRCRMTYTSYRQKRKAVLQIQKVVRRRIAHQEKMAKMLQSNFRMYLARKRYSSRRNAVMCVQRIWRGRMARTAFHSCACTIILLQTYIRRFLAQKELQRRSCSTRILQAVARGHLVRQYIRRLGHAAQLVQKLERGRQARQKRDRVLNQVMMIQALVRGQRVRQIAKVRLAAIYLVQRLWRQALRWKKHVEQVKSAVIIQAAWRGKHARACLDQTQASVIKVQCLFRGWQTRKLMQARNDAAIMLQSVARRYIHGRRRRQCESAVALQSLWRGHAARVVLKAKVLGAIKMQSLWRGRATLVVYQEKRSAVLKIQKNVRGWQTRKDLHTTSLMAVAVQRIWRGHQARMAMNVAKKAATDIQRIWKGSHDRESYLRMKIGAIKVQALVRRRLAFQKYHQLLRAIRLLQKASRIRRLERSLQAYREVVIIVQRLWRGVLARKRLVKAKAGAVSLQAFARLIIMRRRARNFRLAIKKAQALARGWMARKRCNAKLCALRTRVEAANERAVKDPSMQIGARHTAALDVLISSKSLAHILKCCMTLEVSTSLSRICCEALVAVDGVSKLLSVIRSCNRSKPHMELLRHVLRVLQNVTSYDNLLPSLTEAPEAVDTLVELLQQYRPDDNTFVPTGLLLIRACEDGGGIAQADLKQSNVQRRVQGALRLLERKAETERNNKSTRYHKAADKELSVMAPIRILRRIVAL